MVWLGTRVDEAPSNGRRVVDGALAAARVSRDVRRVVRKDIL